MNRSTRSRSNVLPAFAIFVLAFVFTQPTTATASTVVVGTCKNLVQFTTINAAITAAPAGSTIFVCPGTYPEQLTITKNLTLTGLSASGGFGLAASGANNPVITVPSLGLANNAADLYDGSPIAAQIAAVSPVANTPIKVYVSNMSVDGSNNNLAGCGVDLVGVYYQNANGTIGQMATRNQQLASGLGGCQVGLAIYVQSGYASGGSSTVTIQNNSVHNFQKNGITVDGTGAVANISSNTIVGQGPTNVIAQNGIQVSFGATGKIAANTVSDDVYITPDGQTVYSASGILLYDSVGSMATNLVVSGNIVSNTQGAIVAYSDPNYAMYGSADYNSVVSNRITTTLAAGPYLIDGIDMCSNHNTVTSNTVFNSAGAGVHIDSSCMDGSVSSGLYSIVGRNVVNEACAGVLSGSDSAFTESNDASYNVVKTTQSGDVCPAGTPGLVKGKSRPQPMRR